jgi:hypothetical protein
VLSEAITGDAIIAIQISATATVIAKRIFSYLVGCQVVCFFERAIVDEFITYDTRVCVMMKLFELDNYSGATKLAARYSYELLLPSW